MYNNKLQIIVNADDLGYSTEVNEQIEKCIQKGYISSTTLLVNAPAFEDGVRIAKQYSNISVGIHLDLVEFKPLTNVNIFNDFGLIGEDGCFIDGAIFVADTSDPLLQQAVLEEWDAQINKFLSAGISPSHIDSHQHTHTILNFRGILCKLMDKHKIAKVRRKDVPSILLILRERKHPTVFIDKSNAIQPPRRNVIYRRIHFFIDKYRSKKWNAIMSKKYVLTDAFCSFQNFYADRDILFLKKCQTIELMCHPANKAFETETKNLMNDTSWLDHNNILISYNEL